MRLTIQHYYDFGADRELVGDDLVRAEAWDALRTASDGPFALPADRVAWEQAAAREDIVERARQIDAWLNANDIESLASYGVGTAALELSLRRLTPTRRLVLTDYGRSTVARLQELMPDADVVHQDLFTDQPIDAQMSLFHRIDTEFTNDQWREIMRRFAARRILFVATELIDWRRALTEWRRRREYASQTKAGLIRNRAAMESLWAHTHDATPLRFNDLHAWLLEPMA
jgi:hypothetical protein